MKKIIVGITGASGSIYGKKLIESLIGLGHEVHLIITENGKEVLEHELRVSYKTLVEALDSERLITYENNDLFSSIASGSFKTDGMIIAPCSMCTLGKISHGIADTLLIRAADVIIKEKRPLILVTRETPLSAIHLENMLKLSQYGATIFPPVPAFYHRPTTLDEVIHLSVGRILETLNIKNPYHQIWGEKNDY